VEGRAGDVLHALHELDEDLVVVGPHGGEPDPAVAGHHGGDAVPRRRRHPLVPRRLAVVVRVHVDEAGGEDGTVGVDGAAPGPDVADCDDAVAVHRHVGGAGWRAGAVDHRGSADHQVMWHGTSP
jgi:hypothetical protein